MNIADLVSDIGPIVHSLNLPKLKEHDEYYTCSCVSGKHVDKTPSMSIHKDGYFVCFACGYKGPLDKLIRDLTGQSPEEFLKITGIQDFTFKYSMDPKPKKQTIQIDDIDHDLIKITKGNLQSVRESSRAMRYIRQRNIPDYLIEEWKIQFAYYVELNGTTFRDRLIIPIFNEKGKLISYEGRDITGEQKPKVLYPKGGKVGTLFRFSELDLSAPLYVVEGLMDLIALRRVGLNNSTCTFGVSLSENQKRLLTKIEKLVMIPDADDGGDRMLLQVEEFYDKEYTVVRLPRGKDPGDLSTNSLLTYCQNSLFANSEHADKLLRGYGYEPSTPNDSLWLESANVNRNRRNQKSQASSGDSRVESNPKRRASRKPVSKVSTGKRFPVKPNP